MNRCTTNGVHELTPYETYFGRKPILSHLRVFGSIVYVHIPNKTLLKLDTKSKKYILIGYSSEQKGYTCFNPSTRTVQVSRDIVFEESASWYEPDSAPSGPTEEHPARRSHRQKKNLDAYQVRRTGSLGSVRTYGPSLCLHDEGRGRTRSRKLCRSGLWPPMHEEMQELGLRPFNTTILCHRLEGEEKELPQKGWRNPGAYMRQKKDGSRQRR